MGIPTECDNCGHQYRIQDRFAGQELPCKSCGEYFVVPERSRRRRRGSARGKPWRSRSAKSSSSPPPWVMGLAMAAVAVVMMGFLLFSMARRSSDHAPAESAGDGSGLFPVASIPVPNFPEELPPPSRHPAGADIYFVNLGRTAGNNSEPGRRMTMRVYLPAGEHEPGSLGCVLIAPAGTNLLQGHPLDPGDYHDESLPYVEAGFAVVQYSIDGELDNPETASSFAFSQAYKEFQAAHAGVVNGRNALEFVLARLPEVDPQRIYSAGHSSAGVLSLLLAEHEPRINGCMAYAPASDVELCLRPVTQDSHVEALLPGIMTFAKRSSPKTHTKHLECPVFLFHAEDDSTEPIHTTEAFATQLQDQGKEVTFKKTPRGGHYQSMIDSGIPAGIAWLKQLPTERGKTYPQPASPPASSYEPPPFRPPSIPQPPNRPMPPAQRIMAFQLQSYSGAGDATQAARRALRRFAWCDADSVQVDFDAKQVVIGVRGGVINSAPVKSALQQAGFQLGGVSIRSAGR